MNPVQEVGADVRGRFFLVGCPRSGTTLLQSILAAHPDVASFPESHFFRKMPARKREHRRAGMASIATRACVEEFLAEVGRMDLADVMPEDRSESAWAAAFVSVLDALCLAGGSSYWVEKTPGHVRALPLIERHVPRARFIHAVRDGREVVASLFDVTRRYPQAWGGPWSLDKCIRQWNKDVAITRDVIGHPDHLAVDHEQVVSDVAATLGDICRWMGLEESPDLMQRRADAADSVIGRNEPWKQMVREDMKPRQRFATVLTPSQQRYVLERLHGGGQWRRA